MCTWNTLIRACGKLSKLLRCKGLSGKLNLPPNTCMPRREKITMKRKSRRSREAMERIELIREATRLLKDVQYLRAQKNPQINSCILRYEFPDKMLDSGECFLTAL